MLKRPTKRHRFLNDGDELNYLSDVVRYLDSTDQHEKAAPCVHRMEKLLQQRDANDGSIMLQDHWAVLHEVRGNLAQAVVHREREIDLIEHLLSLGPLDSPMEPFMAQAFRALADDYSHLGETEKERQIRRRIEDIEASQSKTADLGALPPSSGTPSPCPTRGLQSRSKDAASSDESSCRKAGRGRNTDRR